MMTEPNPQLLLPLQKANLLRFTDFIPDDNPIVFGLLKNWPLSTSNMIYLEGPVGSGKTHLCEALSEHYLTLEKTVLFISGQTVPAPHFFYEIPEVDCFILDDIDTLLNFSPHYEEALFALYNQVFDNPAIRLMITSSTAIDALPLKLKDLKSRLHAMLPLKLTKPSQMTLEKIIALHAKRLGMQLSEEAIKWLLRDNSHNAKIQLTLLQQLAESSLKDKKRLSLAYVKHVLKLQDQFYY